MSENDVPIEGGSISKIEISPNGTYLVAAICNQDRKIQKIVGWNVENIKKENEDKKVVIDIEENEYIEKKFNVIKIWSKHVVDNTHICVSDDKILAYIYYHNDKINEFSKYNKLF